jgi:ribose transport system permease protein
MRHGRTGVQGMSRKQSLQMRLQQAPPVIWVLLVMIFLFSLTEPTFLTFGNLVNMLRQGSILIILCMGVAFVRISGGIDLSVGGVMTFCGMAVAWLLTKTSYPFFFVFISSLIVGFLFGLMNGLFVTKMNVPSFIATLATQGISLGLSLGMNNGYVIAELPQEFGFFGNGVFLGLPMPIWFVFGTIIISTFLLNFTRFGVYVYAIGGNEDALTLSGKPSWIYKALAFGYAGLMAGIAAIVITSRTMTAQPTVGAGMEFEAFFATVLGGIFAGRGGMVEALLGVTFILVLRNGLNLAGVPTYIQLAIIGIVLLIGIIFSTLLDRKFRQ